LNQILDEAKKKLRKNGVYALQYYKQQYREKGRDDQTLRLK